MQRIPFVLRIEGEENAGVAAVRALGEAFEEACRQGQVNNFSIWHIQKYLFGYGEGRADATDCFDGAFARLPREVRLLCPPGTMRQMYHDIGVVREDKSLIRHRVFATKLKPGCAEEYKRRHDGLIAQRGGAVKEGPESNFTIWLGDGHIFGYCELVRAYDAIEPTPQQRAWTVEWETRQLEIMDWLTDDVDWLTGEKHPAVERVL